MKTEEEIKEGLLNLAKSIAKEFPRAGRIINSEMALIESEIMNQFSPEVAIKTGVYLANLMMSENARNLSTNDLELILEAIEEHLAIQQENEESIWRTLQMKKSLELKIRGLKLLKEKSEVSEAVKKMIAEDPTLTDKVHLRRIFSNYALMAKGKKPEDIPESGEELERVEKMLKLFSLEERDNELDDEAREIALEIGPLCTLTDQEKLEFEKDVITSKIRRLDRCTGNYDDVTRRKDAKVLLEKTKTQVKIDRIMEQISDVLKDCNEFFRSKNEFSDHAPCRGMRIRVVPEFMKAPITKT